MNMQFLPAAMSKQLSALLVSGVAFLTACGGTAATNPAPAVQPGDQQVTLMVGNSMQFMPGSIAVRAGQPIDLVLRNGAGIPHDFALAVGASSPVKIEAPVRRLDSRPLHRRSRAETWVVATRTPGSR